MLKCPSPNCPFIGAMKQEFYYHIGNEHPNAYFFRCGFEGCSIRCQTINALKTHMSRYHSGSNSLFETQLSNLKFELEDKEVQTPLKNTLESLRSQAANFILELQEEDCLSINTTNKISSSMSLFTTSLLSTIQTALQEQEKEGNNTISDDVLEFLESDLFSEFSSEENRVNYLKQNCGYEVHIYFLFLFFFSS